MPTPDLVPLSKIVALPQNPKEHDLGTIHESMDRFGFLERIVINQTTGHLISGHGRMDTLRQMKARGSKAPEGVTVKEGEWMIPVDYVNLSETEEPAAAVALNRLVEIGGWDEQELANVLSDLAAQGEQMLDGIGFDMDDLDEMLARLNGEQEDEEDTGDGELEEEEELTDTPDELLKKYGVQEGDIWQVGDHFIACGDCTKNDTWLSLFTTSGYGAAGGLFTSPPYAEQRAKKEEWYGGIPEDEYVPWFSNVQSHAGMFLDDDASFFLNIKPNVVDGSRVLYVFDLVLSMVRAWDWNLIDEFCWERLGAPGRWHNRLKNGFEPVYQFCKTVHCKFFPDEVAEEGSGTALHRGNKSTGNYYNTNNKVMEWDKVLPSNRIPSFGNAIASGHPAAFPIGLPHWFMRGFSKPGDVWVDPFGGSGTVAVAATRCDRKALLMELSPKYVAVSLERLLLEINQEPQKVGQICQVT